MTRFAALFYANTFMMLNHLLGVNRCITIIGWLSGCLKTQKIDLQKISDNLQYCYSKLGLLLYGKQQKCLWRGYVLYFYAKRAKLPIMLVFGAKNQYVRNNQETKWHCWIVQNGQVCFELDDVVTEYTPFIEYS